ncbi:HTH domain-containing protein [Halosimplex aquaticum]|uniref:HTH domain-containing protein n=1 Tax=Halosimplex aquaticum TaxID=3026162 RepID=A0ABD5XSY4_9EURY|nr:HTH domain-containing protein [Halosimplex aquaticum]
MTPTEREGDLRAELSVRETLPEPAARQRARLRARLRDLETAGRIDGFDVSDSPKRIRRENPTSVDARDRYLAFTQWARDRGVSLRPSFQTRECYAMDTGEKGEWIVFPAISLAVYDDGDLAAVYPHADGEEYHSVADGLSTLAGTNGDESVEDSGPAPVTTAD